MSCIRTNRQNACHSDFTRAKWALNSGFVRAREKAIAVQDQPVKATGRIVAVQRCMIAVRFMGKQSDLEKPDNICIQHR